jgi:hypothetical protein
MCIIRWLEFFAVGREEPAEHFSLRASTNWKPIRNCAAFLKVFAGWGRPLVESNLTYPT